MNKKILTAFSLTLLMASSGFAKSKTYNLDTDHSNVDFKIKHLASKVRGSFGKVEGTIEYDAENLKKLKTTGKIDAASIDTGVEKRDAHLKSADFFDVDNTKSPDNKHITFKSTGFSDITTVGEETKGKLAGRITIHSVTKPIILEVVIHGKPIIDPWGMERLSMSATGTLNRKDFGLNWNKALETGGFVVGDEVELSMDVEAVTKADTPKKNDAKAKNDASVIIKDEKKETVTK